MIDSMNNSQVSAARIYTEQHVIVTRARAVIEITELLESAVKRSGFENGLLTAFIKHTSASLVIFENADPSAMRDLCAWLARLAPERDPAYTHTLEGDDDMPSHLRMVLTRTQETIPFVDGRLCFGTWQGLYLLEHRASGHRRNVQLTLVGT